MHQEQEPPIPTQEIDRQPHIMAENIEVEEIQPILNDDDSLPTPNENNNDLLPIEADANVNDLSDIENANIEYSDESEYDDSDDENSDGDLGNSLRTDLGTWCLKWHISHRQVTKLLHILKRHYPDSDLPLNSKCLLGTPQSPIQTRPCENGEFFYYGIQRYLESCEFQFLAEIDRIELNINWDGISLSGSSQLKLWPIMGSFIVKEYKQISPFVIGAYVGKEIPKNPDFHFEEFAEEVTRLYSEGVFVTGQRILKPFSIRAFICDSEAAPILTGRKSSASNHGCPKCTQIITYSISNTIVYGNVRYPPRTDDSFRNRDEMVGQLF